MTAKLAMECQAAPSGRVFWTLVGFNMPHQSRVSMRFHIRKCMINVLVLNLDLEWSVSFKRLRSKNWTLIFRIDSVQREHFMSSVYSHRIMVPGQFSNALIGSALVWDLGPFVAFLRLGSRQESGFSDVSP